MADASARALGRKISFFRTRRGLSQRDFGAMINRSETWVSQVERGVRRIDRMTVLRHVAETLEVPLAELAADTPIVAEMSTRPATASRLRMMLSSSLTLTLAVQPPGDPADLDSLRALADEAWTLVHAAEYNRLVPLLTDLIPAIEASVRIRKGAGRRTACQILALAYHAAAAALAKLNEFGAAWVAADRAIAAAEQGADQLLMAEGVFRLTLVFQTARLYEQAEHAAATAVAALRPLVDRGITEAVSLQGALQLQRAIVAARQNRASDALKSLAAARAAAAAVGGGRNDHNTEFGPTNVAIHEVHVHVELGDAGTALRIAAGIDASELSPERRGRLHIDIARAQLQRRNTEGAVAALLEAERIAPEQIRNHWMVRNLLHDLDRAGHSRDVRVRGMIERVRPF